MKVLRRRHGDVVFIVTSDNVSWARAQLASPAHNDTFFSADFTRAPAAGPTQGTEYLHPLIFLINLDQNFKLGMIEYEYEPQSKSHS